VRALQTADIILIDELVSPDILDFARREAKKMLVEKTDHGHACEQDEINRLMVALAKAGRRVVRLKGGEGATFGRAGAAIAACRAAGITVEMVPGIGAAQAAAARVLLASIPEMPLPVCCGSPAAPPGDRARAMRSTDRG
jgi:uroporphyrin-III C-methyltransferase/precorrin-2 dehydrogenase/sirohydrochlorin ferrochelatase